MSFSRVSLLAGIAGMYFSEGISSILFVVENFFHILVELVFIFIQFSAGCCRLQVSFTL